MPAQLVLPPDTMDAVAQHFRGSPDEQLAFLVAHWEGDVARVFDHRLVAAHAFEVQSRWHIALGDEERAAVITWAHYRGGALVEAHVHRDGDPAHFSPTDWMGLDQFVPHVWWRLGHRPYVALVFGETTFDAVVWRSGPEAPEPLEGIRVGNQVARRPTGLSLQDYRDRRR